MIAKIWLRCTIIQLHLQSKVQNMTQRKCFKLFRTEKLYLISIQSWDRVIVCVRNGAVTPHINGRFMGWCYWKEYVDITVNEYERNTYGTEQFHQRHHKFAITIWNTSDVALCLCYRNLQISLIRMVDGLHHNVSSVQSTLWWSTDGPLHRLHGMSPVMASVQLLKKLVKLIVSSIVLLSPHVNIKQCDFRHT